MKNIKSLLIVLVFVLLLGNTSHASKMKVYSCERTSKKEITVCFKKVKKAKKYKVEYYWEKSDAYHISKAYCKIVEAKKLKKDKEGRFYIKIPAKATVQYASISYCTGKSKWKSWSGYKQAQCNHKWVDGKCKICKLVKNQEGQEDEEESTTGDRW